MALRHRPIPGAVIAGDGQTVVAGPASVADQTLSGKHQNRHIGNEHHHHGSEDRGCGGEPKRTDDRSCERQDDDEPGDLWKGLCAEEIGTAAGHAPAELPPVIQGDVPVEKAVRAPDAYPGRTLGGVDIDEADPSAVRIAKINLHAIKDDSEHTTGPSFRAAAAFSRVAGEGPGELDPRPATETRPCQHLLRRA